MMSNADDNILIIERPREHVALLRLNRPQVRNALNLPLRLLLAETLNKLDEDPDVRVIIITGNQDNFAAGADLSEMKNRTVEDLKSRESRAHRTALDECSKPVIAAVNGYALGGGCELAIHCDIVVAGEGAVFGQPEVKVGIMPGAGGTQRIVRAAGKHKAARYLLTGDLMPATVAFDLGIVSEIVDDASVVDHAVELAGKIASRAPMAVAAIKELLTLGPDASLATALAFERKAFFVLFGSEDRDEGVAAFLEKRKPYFKGK
jgi:enoyl-CoA hydratase/carnithine racemase